MECIRCGKPTKITLDGIPICEQCFQQEGSCSLEFGGDDLCSIRLVLEPNFVDVNDG